MRFQAGLALALLPVPLAAQAEPARPPAVVDKAFLVQAPATLMLLCAEEARALGPKDSHVLIECGDVYLTAGQRAKAEACFNQAVLMGSQDRQGFRLVALAWLRHGFQKEALAGYQRMASEAGSRWENKVYSLLNAANDLAAAGLVKEGAEYLQQAFKVEKDARNDPRERIRFGRSALIGGKPEAAAPWFAKAVQMDPEDAELWAEIAECYAEHLARRPVK